VTRIKFLNRMGERIPEGSGRSHQPQERVRLPHGALPRRALRTAANNKPTKCYRNTPTWAGTLSFEMPATSLIFFLTPRTAAARTTAEQPARTTHSSGSSRSTTFPPDSAATRLFPRLLLSGCRRPAICCQLLTSDSVTIVDELARPTRASRVNFSRGAAFAW
jgi:hypothetical protein